MRLSLIFFTLAMVTVSIGKVNAELRLLTKQEQVGSPSYGHVTAQVDQQYWITVGYDDKKMWIDLRDFFSESVDSLKRIPVTYGPLLLAGKASSRSPRPLLVGRGEDGWLVSSIDQKNSRLVKTIALPRDIFVRDVSDGNGYYYASGLTRDGNPIVVKFHHDLTNQKIMLFNERKKGEVSNVIFGKDGVFAIINYSDATAEFREITSNDMTLKSTQISGAKATVISLKNGDFLATYTRENQIIVERFDADFNSKWITKLHSLGSVATNKDQLLELPEGVAFVGGIHDRLIVVRLSNNGDVLQTTVDKTYGFHIPTADSYMAVARGNVIHIRGQAMREGDSGGNVTSFYFIETKDK